MSTSSIQEILVELGERSYPIYLGRGALQRLPAVIQSTGAGGHTAVVTDRRVDAAHGDRLRHILGEADIDAPVSALPAGEEHKRLDQIERLCGDFLTAGLDRSGLIIAFGGGVVGDIAGFAAACFMRGLPFIQIPTTIVAQVDSSVGGKTGVNHPLGKNIIGAFHQPSAVVIDMDLLKTLPDREIRAGMAEVIKHAVIADAELFEHIEEHAAAILAKDLDALEYPILRSCEIKSAVVKADEREHGQRANLNYGHTFGHGIEAATGYERFLHGEAVALGMHAAAHLSLMRGLVDEAFVERQKRCIEAYGLPSNWTELPVDATLEAMKRDKKVRAGVMKFVAADRMGHVIHLTDVSPDEARAALEAVRTGR